MDRSPGSVLLVAAWGNPPSWYKAVYRIRTSHPFFSKLAKGFTCTTCSSSVALTAWLQSRGFGTRSLVFGLDTIVDPSKAGNGETLRRIIKETYLNYHRDILGESSCAKEAEKASIDVEVLPGIGVFNNWVYRGSIDAMFNKAFSKLLGTIESMKPSWIMVDLTHGINFQTIAVLYAVVAAAITMGLEDRLVLFNAEPIHTRKEKCINTGQGQSGGKEREDGGGLDELSIIDVSRLQEAITFIRLLRGIETLSPQPLVQALRELRRVDEELFKLINDKVLPSIKLLANSMTALMFREAYTESGDPIGLDICSSLNEAEELLKVVSFSYTPVIVGNEVRYPETRIYQSLRPALYYILKQLCSRLTGETLEDYLGSLGKLYKDLGLLAQYLVVTRTRQELSTIIGYLRGGEDTKEGVNVYSLRILWSLSHKLREKSGKPLFSSWQELEGQRETIRTLMREAEKASKDPDQRDFRNMAAHAGLEYKYLWSIEVGEKGITRVIYRDGVKRFLETLKRY